MVSRPLKTELKSPTNSYQRLLVCEYRFTAPNVKGEKKQWWVMWDYYNGLVRVHDFFDCCKPGKVNRTYFGQ
jgi:hypothetical protein